MLGQQACIHGYTVCGWPAGKLFEQMKLCKVDGTNLRELAKISKKLLLTVDDFGLEVLDTASRYRMLTIICPSHPLFGGTSRAVRRYLREKELLLPSRRYVVDVVVL